MAMWTYFSNYKEWCDNYDKNDAFDKDVVFDEGDIFDTFDKQEHLVSGYIRRYNHANYIFDWIETITFLYYNIHCDEFDKFYFDCNISKDRKCISGCGYGRNEIDPSNKLYNHYQWLIKLQSKKYLGCTFGITSRKNENNCWWLTHSYEHYEFHNSTYNRKGLLSPPGNHIFGSSDRIVLDLDIKKKQLKLFVNNKLIKVKEDICLGRYGKKIKYYLGVHMYHELDYCSIESFSQFHSNNTHNEYTHPLSLLNYSGEIKKRNHPSIETYSRKAENNEFVYRFFSMYEKAYVKCILDESQNLIDIVFNA